MKYPYSFESDKDIYDRAQQLKKFLRLQKAKILGPGEKMGVVCHSKLISGMFASGVEANPDVPGRVDFVKGSYFKLKNCQTVVWKSF